jgi:hypothetical protein
LEKRRKLPSLLKAVVMSSTEGTDDDWSTWNPLPRYEMGIPPSKSRPLPRVKTVAKVQTSGFPLPTNPPRSLFLLFSEGLMAKMTR